MPFTLAHPAAVLPIHSRWKRWLSLAPLVVGSMVPDAEYYLPMPLGYKEHAHTWLGPLYSLPLGIALLLIFYWVAPEIAFLLPSPHREALQRRIQAPALSVWSALPAVCGIVIGAETHIVWDSFSHSDGWLVEHIRFLREPIWRTHPYFISEVLSSLIGIWILLYVYDRWAISQGFRLWTWQDSSWRTVLWLAVLAACVVPALIESHTVRSIMHFSLLRGRHFAIVLAASFVRNLLVALCAVALYVKVFRRRAPLDVVY